MCVFGYLVYKAEAIDSGASTVSQKAKLDMSIAQLNNLRDKLSENILK